MELARLSTIFILIGVSLSAKTSPLVASDAKTWQDTPREETTTPGPEASCFVTGQCIESPYVGGGPASNEIECLLACKSNPDCGWFSFHSETKFCEQISYCGRFESNWKNWISGESSCKIPQCWVQGQCLGMTLAVDIAVNEDDCLAKCKSNFECHWFTFLKSVSECIQFRTCPAIDDTCTNCLSGERSCVANTKPTPTGLTKLLVANGLNGSYLSNVEIIDLSPHKTYCQDLPEFPLKIFAQIGGFYDFKTPILCGGWDGHDVRPECFSYVNNVWTQIESLTVPRTDSAFTTTPELSSSSKNDIMAIGGDNFAAGFLASSEIYTVSGWNPISTSLPEGIRDSCAVTLDETSIMLIGGLTDSQNFTASTLIFNTITSQWSTSSALRIPRTELCCGIIRTDVGNYIIVSGGVTISGITDSTEILLPGKDSWGKGPSLPMAIFGSAMVEDNSSSRVLIVGGYSDGAHFGSIYQLKAPLTITSQWEKLPQELKIPRRFLVAFLISDDLVQCSSKTEENLQLEN